MRLTTETVLRGDSLVGGTVLLETVVLWKRKSIESGPKTKDKRRVKGDATKEEKGGGGEREVRAGTNLGGLVGFTGRRHCVRGVWFVVWLCV
jgi:hypothetical protein